jgi:hypothetical protein
MQPTKCTYCGKNHDPTASGEAKDCPYNPEGSSPKPTAKQMELLRKLCKEGAEIHWWSGIRGPDSAALVVEGVPLRDRERVRTDTLGKFHDWGWVEPIGDPSYAWRNNKYRITEKGRRVVALGVTRKS